MSSLRGSIAPQISFTNQPSTSSASQVTEVVLAAAGLSYSYTYGTGAGEIDSLWSQGTYLYNNVVTGTPFNVSGTVTKNLTSLTGTTGNTVDFARLKFVYIGNNDPTNVLTVGGAGTDPWTGLFTGTITVNPGQFMIFAVSPNDATGWITSGTSFNLQFSASSSTSVTVVLAGCSV